MARERLWESALRRAGLQGVAAKVEDGERLSFEEGVRLYGCTEVNLVGHLANIVRERMHGNVAYYVRNRHLNYTNECGNACRFCAFSAREGGPEPYTLTSDEVRDRLRPHADDELAEVHVVGGINRDLPYSYYLDLLRAVKETLPDAHVKAFTMVELDQIARVGGKSLAQALADLKAAGLDSLPGGGAEVLSTRVHDSLYPAKIDGDRWLELAGAAHQAGLRSTATMLYGHIETAEERVEHLMKLRELQDLTGGFQCFVPLSFHPERTGLSRLPGPSGVEDLLNVAVPRLLLDNFPHVKSFWVMASVAVSQLALWYGADDLDGTIQEYTITRDAETDTRQSLSREQLLQLIRETGRQPVERDALYNAR